ncbi:MAG: beta-galactosidase [Alphaproteobacteria bacterium]|nr:beta-galactosidase [Alphaproteobacteria bacterium]
MLGVCYYPEQWPENMWADDARRMADLGLKYVRIGEFAWSAIEPTPGSFNWGWLDRAVETLGKAGLKIVMGTPTATPPKWLVDRHPDILPADHHGRPRRFGSRRHYCFSSRTFRSESQRITDAVAGRYGRHDAVAGWQTDNEFGCHDTVRSYSPDAAVAFRGWLRARYSDVAALNAAWGNRFWSMEYRSFDEVDLPMAAVTELNPIHRLDFFRFSSDQVANFNAEQVEIIRRHSPGRFVTHNFMGAFLDFDHFKTCETLDLASWDSYPLGFTDSLPMTGFTEAERVRYATTGHPDISAFHHDLYRGVGRGRFWIMEQQPGPVNWALWNPGPAPGIVRLWAWEALAHGAEVVSFFRWRQAPFAQEQMHAGLNRPDNVLDIGGQEASVVAKELGADWWREVVAAPTEQAPVALVFDYEAAWMHAIQPQGRGFSYLALVFTWYTALRQKGVDVDIVPPGRSLDGYRAVFVPSLPHINKRAVQAFGLFGGLTVFGIRTGAKTRDFQISPNLPPGPLQALLPIKVSRVESLRPGVTREVEVGNRRYDCGQWVETVESGNLDVAGRFTNGSPALVRETNRFYLAAWPTRELASDVVQRVLDESGVVSMTLPLDLRVRRRGDVTFAFNFGGDSQTAPSDVNAKYLLGAQSIGAHNLSAWKT